MLRLGASGERPSPVGRPVARRPRRWTTAPTDVGARRGWRSFEYGSMSSLPDDPPTWDWRDDVAFKALRRDAVWDEADLLLATRAWARTALVVSWLTAVGTATGWRTAAWGLLTLVGVLISVVHADRAAVQAVAGRLGRSWPRLARVWTWFFRYPDFAHVNPVGFVEVPSLLAVALVTGALPGDSLVKVVAIGLVMPLVSLAVANMAAHPLWHLDAPPALVRLRPLLGPLFFVIAFVTVWRPADAPAVQLAAVLGGGTRRRFGVLRRPHSRRQTPRAGRSGGLGAPHRPARRRRSAARGR